MRDGHATLACDTMGINGLALGRAVHDRRADDGDGRPACPALARSRPACHSRKARARPRTDRSAPRLLASRNGDAISSVPFKRKK